VLTSKIHLHPTLNWVNITPTIQTVIKMKNSNAISQIEKALPNQQIAHGCGRLHGDHVFQHSYYWIVINLFGRVN
jgi:hypothetical protein